MRLITSIIIMTLTLSVCGQSKFDSSKISAQTNELLKEIIKINIVMGSMIGEGAYRHEQYDNFIKLKEKATINELKELTNHPNTTVRSYAFWALSYDFSVDIFPIVLDHIKDIELVETQFGCFRDHEFVGDFLINVVTTNDLDKKTQKLSPAQKTILDNILIYSPNILKNKATAMNRIELAENFYIRIRELVIKEKNQEALVVLAKYKKEQDIDLILNNISDSEYDKLLFTYKAIIEFPHPAFLPLLEKNLKETLNQYAGTIEIRELYRAIAVYKNEKSVELLRIPFTLSKDMKEYHIEYITKAVQEFIGPVYDEIIWKLWTEEKKITPEIFSYLSRKNPDRSFNFVKEILNNITLYSENYDYGNFDNFIALLLNIAVNQDKDFAFEIIRRNIKKIDVHIFRTFAYKVMEIKDKSFVEPLFSRLETEKNAHVYLAVIKTLVAYKDPEINKKILETRKKNKALNEGWGSEELDKILKYNDIK